MSNTCNSHSSPEAVLTRAQFVQILAKVSHAEFENTKYTPIFTDVPDGKWYSKAVIWASENGVTGGVGGGLFAPDAPVTHAQLAVFIAAFAEKTGFEFSDDADLAVFDDHGDIPAWAECALKKCISEGMISGTSVSRVSSNMTATRAQTAVIIRKLLMRINCLGNVLIFGDSISAFAGDIPDGFNPYYPYVTGTLVETSEQMWYGLLISETGSNLVLNNSWSGSTICYTGYFGYEPSQSFLFRANACLKNGECRGKKIDTVIIQGGGNDTSVSPYGEVKYFDWTEDDLRACLPAFCKLLDYVKTEPPDARIIFLLNESLPDQVYFDMKAACEHYDVECVLFGNLEVFSGHPTRFGMVQFKDQILEQIDKCK